MSTSEQTLAPSARRPWELDATGPASLSQVIEQEEQRVSSGEVAHLHPLPTGFEPLDDVLNGGVRPGELLVIGGAFGVGKTIWGLQVARNAVYASEGTTAAYVCYEHDRSHLMSRLICLESAQQGLGEDSLTLRKLAKMAAETKDDVGVMGQLRRSARHLPLVRAIESYADRLVLVKASGDHSTLDQIRGWVLEIAAMGPRRLLLVVDYLQKIPVKSDAFQSEAEAITYLTQGLKELAMAKGIMVIAVAASDRLGLKSKRMRLSDLRGSSALQYEADVGLILNNKWAIVSREHLVYNPTQSEGMRNWVVMSVEKNRAGRNAVDMEYALDASHFRIVPTGGFVRDRLVDEKVTLA